MHRQALAGHHRLVDLTLTLLHHTVDGDLGPGTHQQQVADRDLGGGNSTGSPPRSTSAIGGARWGEVEQRADRVVGAAAGAHLEPVAEQDERREHGGGLVEHVPATGEPHDQRVGPAGADRDRHQHHHVQSAGAQRAHRAREEDRRSPEDHRQRQQ